MNSTVVSTAPTSTMNITGLRTWLRGIQFAQRVHRCPADNWRVKQRTRFGFQFYSHGSYPFLQ